MLYHLEHNPSEKYDVSGDHADVIAEIKELADKHKAGVDAPPSQLEIPLGKQVSK